MKMGNFVPDTTLEATDSDLRLHYSLITLRLLCHNKIATLERESAGLSPIIKKASGENRPRPAFHQTPLPSVYFYCAAWAAGIAKSPVSSASPQSTLSGDGSLFNQLKVKFTGLVRRAQNSVGAIRPHPTFVFVVPAVVQVRVAATCSNESFGALLPQTHDSLSFQKISYVKRL